MTCFELYDRNAGEAQLTLDLYDAAPGWMDLEIDNTFTGECASICIPIDLWPKIREKMDKALNRWQARK